MSILARLTEPRQSLPESRQRFSNAALKAMIVPLLIESVLQMVVGLADGIMSSRAGFGVNTGVGLDNMIITVFIYLFTALSAGGAVVVSQYIGSKDRDNACLAASQVFHIAGLLSLVSMALMLLCGSALIDAVFTGREVQVLEACKTYMRIVALSFPAIAVYNAGAAVFRAMGSTRITMWVTLAANIVNVIGNAVGVFGLRAAEHGASFGAAAVAWPTTLSWYIAAGIMTWLCFGSARSEALLRRLRITKKADVRVRVSDMLKLNPGMSRRILGVAIPNSVENTLFQASKVVISFVLIAHLAKPHVDANSNGQTFWSLAACMGTAMGTVFMTVIGQCVGAGDTEAAEWYMRKLSRLSLVLAFVWNVFVTLLTPLLMPLYDFSPFDAETKSLILLVVVIHNLFSGLVQPFSGPLSSGLRAAGDVKFTMWASIFCTVFFRTVMSFLLVRWIRCPAGFEMGVIGIAAAMVLDWCVKAILDARRFDSGKWKNRKLI